MLNSIHSFDYLLFLIDKSIKVFSIIPVNGTINKNHAKYKKVANCPISKNGLSGC